MPYTSQVSGIWDHAEIKNLVNGIAGYGVISGMALSVTGSSMVVTVAPGVIKATSGTAVYAGGTTTLSSGHATLPRTDLIIWDDSANNIAVREGTPTAESATQSKPPALDLADDNDLVLGKVYIAATATTIPSANLFQRRLLLGAGDLVIKSADESVTSSATLQNDDELVRTVLANTSYTFEVYLAYLAGTTGDFKAAITFPSGGSLYAAVTRDLTGSAPELGGGLLTSGTAVAGGGLGTSIIMFQHWKGAFLNGGTEGPFQVQFAQNASNGTATTLKAGSFLRLITGV